MFSSHNELKLEINNRKTTGKSLKTGKLNGVHTDNHRSETKFQGKRENIFTSKKIKTHQNLYNAVKQSSGVNL